MKRISQLVTTLTVVMIAMPVWAAGYGSDRHRVNYDYARVVDAQPIVEYVRVPSSERICRDNRYRHRHDPKTPTVVGAIIGGVIGNQFGGGRGKTAATVAGAALGGAIARDATKHHSSRRYCETETSWYEEERIVGWDVTYRYQGETYYTRMNRDPGDRIRVRVDVQPAEY